MDECMISCSKITWMGLSNKMTRLVEYEYKNNPDIYQCQCYNNTCTWRWRMT